MMMMLKYIFPVPQQYLLCNQEIKVELQTFFLFDGGIFPPRIFWNLRCVMALIFLFSYRIILVSKK